MIHFSLLNYYKTQIHYPFMLYSYKKSDTLNSSDTLNTFDTALFIIQLKQHNNFQTFICLNALYRYDLLQFFDTLADDRNI